MGFKWRLEHEIVEGERTDERLPGRRFTNTGLATQNGEKRTSTMRSSRNSYTMLLVSRTRVSESHPLVLAIREAR